MHQGPEEGAGCNDHGGASEFDIQIGPHAGNSAVLEVQSRDRSLKELKVLLQLQRMLHPILVGLLVGLHPRCLNRQALGLIEQPKLDSGHVGIDGHLASQCINLAHDVALGLATDRGVTTHRGNGVDVAREEEGGCTHSRRRQGRFTSRVTGSADDHIIRYRVE